jgi:nicotinamide-nucleotide adenylyltransferase
MKRGLFIGRFQPLHNAHLEDIKSALKEVDELIIGVGSSNVKRNKENPFTFEERVKMIDSVLLKKFIRNCYIFPVPDFNDDEKWVQYIEKEIPKFDIVYTGNSWTHRCFKKFGYKVNKVEIIDGISSTIIRDLINGNKEWKKLVPKEVVKFIEGIRGEEKIRKIFVKR